MLSSLFILIFLFSLCSQNRIAHAAPAQAMENAALDAMAIVYRGPSELGHRYGVQINEALAIVFTIASAAAFFSLVWPHVAETQPRMMELTA